MFLGTQRRTFDCRRCKRKEDKRSAIWGLKPDVDVWNRIHGDSFIDGDLKEFSTSIEVNDQGSDGTVKSGLVSENDTPKSLWSAENWSPETSRRPSVGLNLESRKEESKSKSKIKNLHLKSKKERAGDAKLRAENGNSEKTARDYPKDVTARKARLRESALYSLTDRSGVPERREESVPHSHKNRSGSCGGPKDPVLRSNRSRSKARGGEPGFPLEEYRSRSDGRRTTSGILPGNKSMHNGRRGESNLSSQDSRSTSSGTAKKFRSQSQSSKSRSSGPRQEYERLSHSDRSRSDGRVEDSVGHYRHVDANLQTWKEGSVERNRTYESGIGRRYRKMVAAKQAERDTAASNFKAVKYHTPMMRKSRAISLGKMSPSEFNQRGDRQVLGWSKGKGLSEESYGNELDGGPITMLGRNRKRESSEESYGDRSARGYTPASRRKGKGGSFDESFEDRSNRGHKLVLRRSRKAPSVESYDAKSYTSLPRRENEIYEERLSGTTSNSAVSDSKYGVAYDWNSSYQGSDDLNHEVQDDLGRRMTSGQFWKLTMGCLETRPRRGKRQADCKVCEGHEHRSKEIMEEAERTDRAQWTKKLLNQVDGISNGIGSQRSRYPWSVHDEKIKESLKRIATPRRLYDHKDGSWPGVYDEVERSDVEESPKFQYLYRHQQNKQGRTLSSYREEYSDDKLSRPDGYSRTIGGNDLVTEIVIPDPRKTWKRQNGKSRNMRFISPDKVARRTQSTESAKLVNQDFLKKEKLPDLAKKVTADHGMLANQETVRKLFLANLGEEKNVTTDHGVLGSQKSLRKQLLVNLEQDMSRVSRNGSTRSPEDSHLNGKLSSQRARKQQPVNKDNSHTSRKKIPNRSDTKERRSTKPDVRLKSRSTSACNKSDYTSRDAKKITDSNEDMELNTNGANAAAVLSRERDPMPREVIDVGEPHSRGATHTRCPTPWAGGHTSSYLERVDKKLSKEEDKIQAVSKQEEEPGKVPSQRPTMTARREARPVSASGDKTSARRYCPSSAESRPCQRFVKKEEASRKMLLDQEELRITKFPRDMLSTRSRWRPQTISSCPRFVGHEDNSSSFLQKKHEDEIKLEKEAKEWCSPKDLHVQSVMKRARDMRTPTCQRFLNHDEKRKDCLQRNHELEDKPEQDARESPLPREQHVQSMEERAQDLRSAPRQRYKREVEVRTPPGRQVPKSAPVTLRNTNAPRRQKLEPPRSCDISPRQQEENRISSERSWISSREGTPGNSGMWDAEDEETGPESLRDEKKQREARRPCNIFQTHDERSRVVLEQARIKLEEALGQWRYDFPMDVPPERCQNCEIKREEVDLSGRRVKMKRAQDSTYSPHRKKS